MNFPKNKIVFICVLLVAASAQVAANECKGEGAWEWGTKAPGPKEDPKAPFITDEIEGDCVATIEDRQAAHNTVDSVPKTGKKIALFSMGVPGAGKSSSLRQILAGLNLNDSNFVNIDADAIRALITTYRDKLKIPSTVCTNKFRSYIKAATWCYNAGWDLVYMIHDKALDSEKDFIHDSPCRDWNYCKEKMQQAFNKGYKVYLYGVYIPIDNAKNRAVYRAFHEGRWVDPNLSEKYYNDINEAKAFDLLAQIALQSGGEAFIFDNAISGRLPILVYKKSAKETCGTKGPATEYFLKQDKLDEITKSCTND